ncbi:putative chitinase [Seiridium cardinale]|uniref:Chitinase n=1 Tax=Seiridium cardinale TaxID=138064 RepID=A0ABR2XJP3_9PEZI
MKCKPCSPACDDAEATIVARNSNSYQVNDGGQTVDLTYTGGFQAYRCKGFVPSSITNSGNLVLYGQAPNGVSKRDEHHSLSVIEERGLATVEKRGAPLLLGALWALCIEAAGPLLALAPFTFGLSAGAAAGVAAAAIGFVILVGAVGWLFGGKPSQPNTGVPTTVNGRTAYGQWSILNFGGGNTKTSCDCAVTYTCFYGQGWDEVCDNQRWAINKMLNGKTVYHPLLSGRADSRAYSGWAFTQTQRNAAHRTLVQGMRSPKSAQCQLDEFPMGNLQESGNLQPQACRLVNGPANMAQGGDYSAWKQAQWLRCAQYRITTCKSKDLPPATWKFGPLNGQRGGGSGKNFFNAYGFDSQTPGSLCFASFTYTDQGGRVSNTMVTDHGFRALDDDPSAVQTPYANSEQRPYNLQPGVFQRDIEISGNSSSNDTDPSPDTATTREVCHVDLHAQEDDTAELDYDNLQSVDMGPSIDFRCLPYLQGHIELQWLRMQTRRMT